MKYYQKCVKFACNYFKNSSPSGGLRLPDPLPGLRPWTSSPDPLWFCPHHKPSAAYEACLPKESLYQIAFPIRIVLITECYNVAFKIPTCTRNLIAAQMRGCCCCSSCRNAYTPGSAFGSGQSGQIRTHFVSCTFSSRRLGPSLAGPS